MGAYETMATPCTTMITFNGSSLPGGTSWYAAQTITLNGVTVATSPGNILFSAGQEINVKAGTCIMPGAGSTILLQIAWMSVTNKVKS